MNLSDVNVGLWRFCLVSTLGFLSGCHLSKFDRPVAAVVAPVVSDQNQQVGAPVADEGPVFARVGDRVITVAQFEGALRLAGRQRYYHGQPPTEAEQRAWRRDMGNAVVDQALLEIEARRRGLQPDMAKIQKILDDLDQRVGSQDPSGWPQYRSRMMTTVREAAIGSDQVKQLRAVMRSRPEPDEKAIRDYYDQHPDKFLDPAQIRLSVLLLTVDVGASSELWQQREDEAAALRAQMLMGGNFAEIARAKSGHTSATQGGDIGYIEENKLDPALAAYLAGLVVGVVSEPKRVAEGVGLYRIDERRQPTLRPYDQVRDAARLLWIKDDVDAAWRDLKLRLRKEVSVSVDERVYDANAVDGDAFSSDEGGAVNERDETDRAATGQIEKAPPQIKMRD